jgi:hypothetical protein
MPNIVPGVVWSPIDYSGYPRRRKGRGACAHVAVVNSATLRPSGGNSWHFYLPKAGPAIQYVDLDYVAYAQLEGNATMVSWESQGGVTNADGEPWTDNQCEWAARIYAHLMVTEGAPAQLMPDSRSTSRGLGCHRLGINPWRVSGGETWSSSNGKLCPGAAKIAQLPRILSRAIQITTGNEEFDMASSEELKNLIIGYGQRVERIDVGEAGALGSPWGYGRRIEDLQARVTRMESTLGQILELLQRPTA